MESRVIWLVPGVWSLVAAVSLACGSTDPGEINVEPGHGRSRTGPDLMDASLPPPAYPFAWQPPGSWSALQIVAVLALAIVVQAGSSAT